MATHLGMVKSTLSMGSSGGQTSFAHTGNTSGDPHSVDPLWGKDHWDMDNLPETYACKSGNPCMYSYRTPYEALTAHQWTCGDDFSIVSHRVPGCGEKYYKCPNYAIPDYHNTFSCTRYNLVLKSGESSRVREYCGTNFRYCTNFTYDSQGNVATITSAGRCSKLLGAGQSGSHNHNNSDDPDTSPGKHRHSEVTETTITYACGVHSGVASSASNHVAAGCGNPNHFICDSSDHSTSSCGHLGHFNCDGKTHVEEQCTVTNSKGDRCTYKFWRCVYPNVPSYGPSHPHQYPAPPTVTCARKACGQTVSNRLEHRVDCSNCNSHYWTCISGAANNHTTIFTCRRAGCGVTFTKCSNGTCTSNSGTHNYHWAQ